MGVGLVTKVRDDPADLDRQEGEGAEGSGNAGKPSSPPQGHPRCETDDAGQPDQNRRAAPSQMLVASAARSRSSTWRRVRPTMA
jgi:hypothetical protein